MGSITNLKKISGIVIPKLSLVILILLAVAAWATPEVNYSIIITVDGLRPDAITPIKTPNLYFLLTQGSYTLEAETVNPSTTLPAHTSLITGVKPERHKTYFNFWTEGMSYIDLETIFSIAKKEKSTAMFVGKDKLKYLAKPGTIDYFKSSSEAPNSVEVITNSFITYFTKERPQLTLIHFPEPDLTGHEFGWMTKEYFTSLKRVDQSIREILETIRFEGALDETLIIVTADHGGKGKDHKEYVDENIKIPWIALGNKVRKNHKIEGKVNIDDTAPTVLHALGINTPSDWDGKSNNEIFESQVEKETGDEN